MISGAVLNIILDPIFIFGLGLGVTGASLATCISQFVGCAVLVIGCSRKGNLTIHPRHFSPALKLYKEMVRGGLPSLFRQGLASVAAVTVNYFARGYGDTAIAAFSIVNRVAMFAASALVGFGQGFQPVCGFNYGAKLYGRVKRAFWFCVKLSCAIMGVVAVALFIFAPKIIALFRKEDAEVIRVGALALRLHCVTFPFTSWVVLCNMMMQTIGKPFEASLLAMSRQGLFLIPLLFILSPLLGLFGIQLATPVSDLGAFLLAIPIMVKVLRQMKGDAPAP
jgi:putative MATE family efflux protein